MNEAALNRRLRRMKREEARLRGSGVSVWRLYFAGPSPRYGRETLLCMDEGALEMVERDFYAEMLYRYLHENGWSDRPPRDPALLGTLGLGPGAQEDEIKKRFRELAHRLHPDHGGSADEFRRALEAYRKLGK